MSIIQENWSNIPKLKQDKLKIACLENGGLPAIVDGDRFVCIKLSHKAQKEMNDLKKKLNYYHLNQRFEEVASCESIT